MTHILRLQGNDDLFERGLQMSCAYLHISDRMVEILGQPITHYEKIGQHSASLRYHCTEEQYLL